jgi:uncharacterized membrane protein
MPPPPVANDNDPMDDVDWDAPFRWLAMGARDLRRNPRPGLMHGALLAVVGWLLLWLAHDQFWWLAGAFSGFLIVAPVLATGLYAVSRAADHGRLVCCSEVIHLWTSGDRRLMGFGVLLGLAGTGWVMTSAGLITVWSPVPIRDPLDFVRHVMLADNAGLFEVWLLLGALMAAPMFASSVVTLPMLVDTRAPLRVAVVQSWRAVGAHPGPLALWAVMIVVLVGLAFATGLLGLLVVVPLLGHGSWHAYRNLVQAGAIVTYEPR